MSFNALCAIISITCAIFAWIPYFLSKWRRRNAATKPASLLSQHPCALSHEFIPIEVQATKIQFAEKLHEATLILKNCSRCGENVTVCLMGSWTLGQILRKKSEIAELNGMVAK